MTPCRLPPPAAGLPVTVIPSAKIAIESSRSGFGEHSAHDLQLRLDERRWDQAAVELHGSLSSRQRGLEDHPDPLVVDEAPGRRIVITVRRPTTQVDRGLRLARGVPRRSARHARPDTCPGGSAPRCRAVQRPVHRLCWPLARPAPRSRRWVRFDPTRRSARGLRRKKRTCRRREPEHTFVATAAHAASPPDARGGIS